MTYKTIHHGKMKAARRKIRRKRERWGGKTIVRAGKRRGHG